MVGNGNPPSPVTQSLNSRWVCSLVGSHPDGWRPVLPGVLLSYFQRPPSWQQEVMRWWCSCSGVGEPLRPLGVMSGSVSSAITVPPAFLLRAPPGRPHPPGCPRCPPPPPEHWQALWWVGSDTLLPVRGLACLLLFFLAFPCSLACVQSMEVAETPAPSWGCRPQGSQPTGVFGVEQFCPVRKRWEGHLVSHATRLQYAASVRHLAP